MFQGELASAQGLLTFWSKSMSVGHALDAPYFRLLARRAVGALQRYSALATRQWRPALASRHVKFHQAAFCRRRG